jgi:hypothetical protein
VDSRGRQANRYRVSILQGRQHATLAVRRCDGIQKNATRFAVRFA